MEQTPSPKLSRLTTLEEFVDLAVEWNTLLAESGLDNVFLSHSWLSEWWRVYGPDLQMWVVMASAGTQLYGIAPLCLYSSPGGARHLRFIGHGEVAPNHLDLVARPEERAAFADRLLGYLAEAREEWDILDLESLAEDSPLRSALADWSETRGMWSREEVVSRCPYASLPANYATYLAQRGRKTRGQVRTDRRRLERNLPDCRFARVESQEELGSVFDALVQLHQARWQRLGQPGVYSSPTFLDFHRAMAQRALDEGTLRLYYIEAGHRVIAGCYCFLVGGRLFYYSSGFDEQYASYSLGIQLLAYLAEESIAEGATELDMLQGVQPYKLHWATAIRENFSVQTASPQTRAHALWLKMEAGRLKSRAAAGVADAGRRALNRLATAARHPVHSGLGTPRAGATRRL